LFRLFRFCFSCFLRWETTIQRLCTLHFAEAVDACVTQKWPCIQYN
jgi:hypothetical protein